MIIPRRKPYFASNTFNIVINSIINKNYFDSTQALERRIAKVLKITNPIIVSSGRVGLKLILKNSDLKPHSEIIMPAYTFGPLVNVIKDLGFIPRPIDIDPKNFQLSTDKIKKAINKKTGAILATHLFGELCEIEEILKIAKKNKLLLIEDCAQAIGATTKNRPAGMFGNISISSFNIAKPLQGISGGLVFGNDLKIINRIRKDILNSSYDNKNVIKDIARGLIGYYLNQTVFWFLLMYVFSFKRIQDLFVKAYRSFETKKTIYVLLNPLLSMIINLNLVGYKERLIKRRFVRSQYIKKLNKYINFQEIRPYEKGTVDMLVAKINGDVYKLRRYLSLKGIDIAIVDEIADLNRSSSFADAESLYNGSIALPIYETMTIREINYVSRAIIKFLKK